MYPKCPEIFHPRISRFIAAWKGAESWVKTTTLMLLAEIAKLHPEVIIYKGNECEKMITKNKEDSDEMRADFLFISCFLITITREA